MSEMTITLQVVSEAYQRALQRLDDSNVGLITARHIKDSLEKFYFDMLKYDDDH